jgi:hypothetical protein
MGKKRVRANSPIRVLLGRQQRTRFDFRPGGLGENRSVEFPRSSAYADGGKAGRKETNGDNWRVQRRSPPTVVRGPCIRRWTTAGAREAELSKGVAREDD